MNPPRIGKVEPLVGARQALALCRHLGAVMYVETEAASTASALAAFEVVIITIATIITIITILILYLIFLLLLFMCENAPGHLVGKVRRVGYGSF